MSRMWKTLAAWGLARLGLSTGRPYAPQAERDQSRRLRAKLDHERDKVRKLVEIQARLSAEQAEWMAERGGMERRLAVLESQRRLLIGARPRHYESDSRAGQAVDSAQRPPLRILVAGPIRKTVFEFVRGAMISSAPSQGPFDLLVIPRPEKQDLDQIADSIPQAVWSAVRAGRTRLILDGSSEGNLHRAVLEGFQSLAERTGMPLGEIVYLTQDRLAADPRAVSRRRFDVPLPVLNYDYYLHKTLFPLLELGQAAFRDRLAPYIDAPRRGRRAFLSLNLSPREHRVLLLARLLRDELWDNGFISFGGVGSAGREGVQPDDLLRRFKWRGFEAAAHELAPQIAVLQRKGAILFGMPDGAGGIRHEALRAGDLEEYRRSWFSVVTETEMSRDILRVTEKVLKPVLNFHPFVVFGNPGALALIRSYGIQTFPELFDESYDDEENPARRFDMVYGQVCRLARMDEAELDRLEASVAEKVVFNARWGLTELPRLFQDTLLPAAIERMLPAGLAGRLASLPQ